MAFPDFLDLTFEAHRDDTNCHRLYQVRAGRDLFGAVVIETRFARVGASGRTIREAFEDEGDAVSCVRRHLARRGGSQKRNGVPYRMIEARAFGDTWLDLIRRPSGSRR